MKESLSLEVSRYFADPGRKYQQETQRLESEMIAERAERRRRDQRQKEELEQERKRHSQEQEQQRSEYEISLRSRDKQIEELRDRQRQFEDSVRREKLKRSGKIRLGSMLLLLVVGEAVLLYFTWQFGEGANFFQRVSNSFEIWAGLYFLIVAVLTPIVVGGERLRAINWPWSRES